MSKQTDTFFKLILWYLPDKICYLLYITGSLKTITTISNLFLANFMGCSVQKKITVGMDLTFLIFIIFFLGCASSESVLNAEGKPAAVKKGRSSSSEEYNKLLAKTQKAGSIRIIARLNIPFVPDGQLSAQEATDQQARISEMQAQLCEALSGYHIKGIKRFKHSPYIAMKVDSKALRALIDNSLILSLEEDAPLPPAIR